MSAVAVAGGVDLVVAAAVAVGVVFGDVNRFLVYKAGAEVGVLIFLYTVCGGVS